MSNVKLQSENKSMHAGGRTSEERECTSKERVGALHLRQRANSLEANVIIYTLQLGNHDAAYRLISLFF